MTTKRFDELETQLRALGRRQFTKPPADVAIVARERAAAALAHRFPLLVRRARRRTVFGLSMVLAVTLPIPGLFVWIDWTAFTALLRTLLPAATSEIVSTIYLWLKVCALGITYGIGVPLLVWGALRIVSAHALFEVEEAAAEA